MTLRTHCTNRAEMVKAISEHLTQPPVYQRPPTYAYRIGNITVNRDSSISGEQSDIEALMPFLRERGYIPPETAAPEPVTPAAEPEAIPAVDVIDLEAGAPFAPEPHDRILPIADFTIQQRVNLLRLLCSKQYILRRMMKTDSLYIERAFVEALCRNMPESIGHLLDWVKQAREAHQLRGMDMDADSLWMTLPNGIVYVDLIERILRTVKAATHVRLAVEDADNEKYAARAFLIRLGYSGEAHKEARHALLDHLHGFAAFRDDAGMQAHKERQAAKRRQAKKAGDAHEA